MLSGMLGGSDSESFQPSKAPKMPKRNDENIDNRVMQNLRGLTKKNSYTQSIIGGSAEAPSRSYSAQLFSANPSGM